MDWDNLVIWWIATIQCACDLLPEIPGNISFTNLDSSSTDIINENTEKMQSTKCMYPLSRSGRR